MIHQQHYRVTAHAKQQLAERWPDTVLRPSDFAWVTVPTDAPLIGYDPSSTAMLLAVPETPMVAIVVGGVVATFLTRQAADANIALRGYGTQDFRAHNRSGSVQAAIGDAKPC